MSQYATLYKYGKRSRDFFEALLSLFPFSFLYFGGVFNKTIIPLALVGCEMIIANSRATRPVGCQPSHIKRAFVEQISDLKSVRKT